MSLAPVTNRTKRDQAQANPNYGMANVQEVDPYSIMQQGGMSPFVMGGMNNMMQNAMQGDQLGSWQDMMQNKVGDSELMRQLLGSMSGNGLFGF